MLQIDFKRKSGDAMSLFDEILKDVMVDNAEIKREVMALGTRTAVNMLAVIATNKKRPQNGEDLTLEEHIRCEFFDGGWGVGDIEELKKNAPYWAAVNFGSAHMVGHLVTVGAFSPVEPKPNDAFFRQDRWVAGGKGSYSFIVKKPIPAMNYIEKTIFWLSDTLDKLTPQIVK